MAWANARMLGNLSGSLELTLIQAAMGGGWNCVAFLQMGSLLHQLAMAKPTVAGKVAVRGFGSRGSKCGCREGR